MTHDFIHMEQVDVVLQHQGTASMTAQVREDLAGHSGLPGGVSDHVLQGPYRYPVPVVREEQGLRLNVGAALVEVLLHGPDALLRHGDVALPLALHARTLDVRVILRPDHELPFDEVDVLDIGIDNLLRAKATVQHQVQDGVIPERQGAVVEDSPGLFRPQAILSAPLDFRHLELERLPVIVGHLVGGGPQLDHGEVVPDGPGLPALGPQVFLDAIAEFLRRPYIPVRRQYLL